MNPSAGERYKGFTEDINDRTDSSLCASIALGAIDNGGVLGHTGESTEGLHKGA